VGPHRRELRYRPYQKLLGTQTGRLVLLQSVKYIPNKYGSIIQQILSCHLYLLLMPQDLLVWLLYAMLEFHLSEVLCHLREFLRVHYLIRSLIYLSLYYLDNKLSFLQLLGKVRILRKQNWYLGISLK